LGRLYIGAFRAVFRVNRITPDGSCFAPICATLKKLSAEGKRIISAGAVGSGSEPPASQTE